METKTVKINKVLHKEIRRYLADNAKDGDNITSFLNDATKQHLIRNGHKFLPEKQKATRI